MTPDNTPADDEKVWQSIREDTTMIFQWESQSATAYLRQLFSDSTIAKIKKQNPNFSYMDLLSIGNGAIRPAGESYRDKLAQGIYQDNGNDALNDFMKPTLGYCIEENQMVSTLHGEKPIKDVDVGEEIYTQDGVSVVSDKYYTGMKPTIKINTKYSSIVCTKNHRIFTAQSWKEAGVISEGDCIAVRVGNSSLLSYDIKKLMLIGYLLGDGILNNKNNVTFVNRDLDVIHNFCDIVQEFDNCDTSITNRTSRVNHLDLYYANVKHIQHRKVKTSVAEYLCDIGLKYEDGGGKLAKDKEIPAFVFNLNTECILALLGAYTDTDCCIKNNGRKMVTYKTASKKLCDGLVELLRLVGFISTVYYDNSSEAYAISVLNAPEFLLHIYDYSFKTRKAYELQDLTNCRNHDSFLSRYFIKDLVVDYGNVSFKKIYKETGINLYQKQKYISISSVKKIDQKYPGMIPQYLLNQNIKWVPVTSVNDYGECNVYDITVPEGHNFICQGMVVHNCVYQEQIIEFLHKFCGFTMGEADIVRRHFSKKTGTEDDIPIIKDGGHLSYGKDKQSEHYIKGFIQTMHDDYGVPKEDAERIIVNFLQVIIDASDYLFSKNHADPYSWIGYICGYLRYYYPLEFITTALNIFEGKEEKSLAIINYAKKRGIRISPIKFRHSIAQYSFDKETNEIFKGISSIKFMNATVANEIYELRNNQYKNFIELLYDLRQKTSINSKQLKILIDLDFFEEFGDANNLAYQFQMFDMFNGKVQFKKSKLEEWDVPESLIRPFAEKETDKMFSGVRTKEFMIAAVPHLKTKRRTLKEKIAAQITHLGYLDIVGDSYKGLAVVLSLDTKYAPKLKLYSLKNGTIIECKIKKQIFNRNKLKVGDILEVKGQTRQAKLRRTESGSYETVPGVMELWITNYRRVEDI